MNILVALLLDQRNPEVTINDQVKRSEGADNDILTKQARIVFKDVISGSEKTNRDSILNRQSLSALMAKDARGATKQVEKSQADKAKLVEVRSVIEEQVASRILKT